MRNIRQSLNVIDVESYCRAITRKIDKEFSQNRAQYSKNKTLDM